jgi:hypothetical protein
VDSNVVNMALECADYDEERACIFLSSIPDSEEESLKQLSSEYTSSINLVSKGIQTRSFIEVMPGSPMNIRKCDDKIIR